MEEVVEAPEMRRSDSGCSKMILGIGFALGIKDKLFICNSHLDIYICFGFEKSTLSMVM